MKEQTEEKKKNSVSFSLVLIALLVVRGRPDQRVEGGEGLRGPYLTLATVLSQSSVCERQSRRGRNLQETESAGKHFQSGKRNSM